MTKNKEKVAMIVLNAVSHDIRVLKEARSLKNNYYHVSIIGLQDKFATEYEKIDGIEIIRTRSANTNGNRLVTLANDVTKPWKLYLAAALSFCFLLIWIIKLVSKYQYFPNVIFDSVGKIISYPFLLLSFIIFLVFFGDILYKTFSKILKRTANKIHVNILNISKLILELHRINRVNPIIQSKLLEMSPAIVHCHDLNSLIIGAAFKKTVKGQCALVYDSHEIFELTTESRLIRRVVFAYLQRKLSKQVDGFITINRSIGTYLKSKYPKLPEINVVKNAAVFKKIKNTENMFTKHLNIPDDKNILLFQGGFSSGRGLTKLLMAGKYMKDNWVIVFMGWGKLQTALEQTAQKQGLLNSQVFFCDKVSQEVLPYWTSSATIGIIPYENTCLNHFYCTPNKLWEYTLAGIPILASPFPEMKKIINKGVGWLLEDPINEYNIAGIVNSLTDKDIQLAKKKCDEFIREDNWSKYEERLVSLYDSLKPMNRCAS